ncbi:MAG: hypothetical protein CVU62_00285 [Deltaproteobacteria bacterium HGW-Deltaproteobacteria-2]|jgi:hypothetical protein|nr:MAG: hypothetical protein CVU62_00285 [Deltaproteobacteria bacterium HGW-Deltaproteobacteria-2]
MPGMRDRNDKEEIFHPHPTSPLKGEEIFLIHTLATMTLKGGKFISREQGGKFLPGSLTMLFSQYL